MLNFLLGGGLPIIFTLVFGLIAVVAAARFAIRPKAQAVAAIKALTSSVIFSSLCGVAADLAAVGKAAPEFAASPEGAGQVHLILLVGFAESMAPAILGFGLLQVSWILVAFGYRRLAPQLP
jgi:hypothetical protein